MKIHRVFAAVSVLALQWLAAIASAQPADAPDRERRRIADERAATEARHADRLRGCATRFVVTSCVEDAKRERRESLSRLKRAQNAVDDSVRRQRASARAEALVRRAAEEAQRSRDATLHAPRERAAPASIDMPSARRATGEPAARQEDGKVPRAGLIGPRFGAAQPLPRHRVAGDGGERRQQEARSRATFDAAQRAAEAHRSEIEARNAMRAATHKPSVALPLPTAPEFSPAARP